MQFIDTHTHIFLENFDDDISEVYHRALEKGIDTMLLPNIDTDSILPLKKTCQLYGKHCKPMMGLHPGSVNENVKTDLSIIKKELDAGEYVAVGEIGMDLYWDKTYIKEQQFAFEQQIHWAIEKNLPIVIHAREAFNEIFDVLDNINTTSLKGVFHCFTGGKDEADKILSYGGFKMGIGGVLTYKNSGLDKVIKDVDLEHLILETDAPFLPPTPYRGKRNEPAYLLLVAQKLADIKQVSLEEVADITTKNAKGLFNI